MFFLTNSFLTLGSPTKRTMVYRTYDDYSCNEDIIKVILFDTLFTDEKESRGWVLQEPDYILKKILRGYNVYYTQNQEGIWIHKYEPRYIG